MKKKFISKKKRKKRNRIFFLIFILIGVFLSYKRLEVSKIKIKDKDFIHLIVSNTFSYEEKNFIETFIDKTIEVSNPVYWLRNDYQKNISTIKENKVVDKKPLVYLYNSHQGEEYAFSDYVEFSVHPTVMMNNYILEDFFNKNNFFSFVEEKSIKDILSQNNWKYSESYRASRLLLEDVIVNYPSLKYFIDIHRDSLDKSHTTITIGDKDYASLLFIVGLENPNYQENLSFTEKINSIIQERYPGLSKGIYKKSGPGVNGVYNQDFSPNTILIEIGGYQNTTSEVLNSTLAFGNCFLEAIS